MWMLANRITVCYYFPTKTFAPAPPLGSWLIAKVVDHILLAVKIPFEALQVESSVPPINTTYAGFSPSTAAVLCPAGRESQFGCAVFYEF
jgi:hypothetical protein